MKLKNLAISGMQYLQLNAETIFKEESGEINQEAFEKLRSKRAALAGLGPEIELVISEEAKKMVDSGRCATYDEAETMLIQYVVTKNNVPDLNAKLDKYSQRGHPGMRMLELAIDAGTVMKFRQVNKSSKGKHPSNYTPPKKKRK